MFGIYRYLLALLTIFSHFHPIYFGRLNWVGMYGLFGFYVLSGYLMTRTLHDVYGFTREGVGRFLWNRALRVYPAYWCAAIVSLLVVTAIPATVRLYTGVMGAPTTVDGILRNVFVFGMHAEYGPRIVTPAWSLSVELFFYVAMALGLSRTRWTVAAWVVAGIAYTVWAVRAGVPFPDRYSTIAAASLPFSMGAAIYFFARPGGSLGRFGLPLLLLFLGGDLVAPRLVPDVMLHGFYVALACTGILIFCLAQVRSSSLPRPIVVLDRWLGDLTYPMFLLHLPVAYVVAALVSPGVRPSQNLLLLVGLPAIHLVALAVVLLVEHRIQPLRERIRERRDRRPTRQVAPTPRPAFDRDIPEVEALRGLAIALVVLMHAEGMFNATRALAAPVSPLRAYVLAGHTGVSLFFILSGFLLARPFLREASGGTPVSRPRFFARRALRIMPLYALMVVVATLVCASTVVDLRRGLPFLFFLNSVEGWSTPLPGFSWVWWSLATEAQFYLVLPLLPLVLRSRRGRAVGAALVVAYALAYAAFATGALRLATLPGQNRLAHSLLGRAPLFACGIAAAAIYDRLGPRLRAWADERGWVRAGGADLALAAVVLALGMLLRAVLPGNYFANEAYAPSWHLVEGPLWATILLLLLLAPLRSKRVFANDVLGHVGRLSYSIYLLHLPVLFFGLAAIKRQFGWTPAGWTLASAAVFAVLMAACVGIATLTYDLIERPMLERRRRLPVAADEREAVVAVATPPRPDFAGGTLATG